VTRNAESCERGPQGIATHEPRQQTVNPLGGLSWVPATERSDGEGHLWSFWSL